MKQLPEDWKPALHFSLYVAGCWLLAWLFDAKRDFEWTVTVLLVYVCLALRELVYKPDLKIERVETLHVANANITRKTK